MPSDEDIYNQLKSLDEIPDNRDARSMQDYMPMPPSDDWGKTVDTGKQADEFKSLWELVGHRV